MNDLISQRVSEENLQLFSTQRLVDELKRRECDPFYENNVLIENQQFKILITEFLRLLDIEEETDSSGKKFKPNYISSCRVLDADKMGKILHQLKGML